MKKIFFIIFLITIFILPGIINAQPLVPCGRGFPPPNDVCKLCHIFILFQNILNFLLFEIVPVLAILAIAWAGVIFITSSGNPGSITHGKEILKSVALALLIVYGAWLLINLFFLVIGVNDWTNLNPARPGGWFQINCST